MGLKSRCCGNADRDSGSAAVMACYAGKAYFVIAAWAAASRAIGTRNGQQDT